jgi:alkanesulfonate monooxygenase SsuD/methylene tetrahydromethanopterin reductase-like flavin-dependent oxidoreductase (luciferase family)
LSNQTPLSLDQATLQALASFPDALAAHYALFPRSHRNWRPSAWEGIPSEHLTPIEQLCHVRDIEIEGYQKRFHRTLTESLPYLESLDTDEVAQTRSYASADESEVLASFRAARTQTIDLLSGVSAEQLRRPALFEGYGTVTLKSLVHYLCSHDQQHLAGLQWLLGQIEAVDFAKRES